MSKIRMVQTIPGSMDGINAREYMADQEYDVDGVQINRELSDIFLKCGAAVLVRERKPAAEAFEEAIAEESSEEDGLETTPGDLDAVTGGSKPDPKVMRVFQLADELGVSYKKIVKAANGLGIEVKAAQSGLTESEIVEIKAEFEK